MTNMLNYREYRDDEVMTILAAYRDIFGQQLPETLVDYWDLHPSRRADLVPSHNRLSPRHTRPVEEGAE
jgi:hypothetical protein